MDEIDPAAQIPENPWARVMGGLGKFFARRFGGGSYREPPGHDVNWEDIFPMIVDPWQRHLNTGSFRDLSIMANIVVYPTMVVMDGLTLFRANIYGMGNPYKVDSVKNGNTRGNTCQVRTFSKSDLRKIVL